jgi:hypothetical protein
MGCDYALSTELGATVAAATAGSPLEYAFDHPRQRLDPMLRPCATRVDRPAWRAAVQSKWPSACTLQSKAIRRSQSRAEALGPSRFRSRQSLPT